MNLCNILNIIMSEVGPQEPGARLLFVALVMSASPGHTVSLSTPQLTCLTGMSDSSIRRHRQNLVDEMWIDADRKEGRGAIYSYRINDLQKKGVKLNTLTSPCYSVDMQKGVKLNTFIDEDKEGCQIDHLSGPVEKPVEKGCKSCNFNENSCSSHAPEPAPIRAQAHVESSNVFTKEKGGGSSSKLLPCAHASAHVRTHEGERAHVRTHEGDGNPPPSPESFEIADQDRAKFESWCLEKLQAYHSTMAKILKSDNPPHQGHVAIITASTAGLTGKDELVEACKVVNAQLRKYLTHSDPPDAGRAAQWIAKDITAHLATLKSTARHDRTIQEMQRAQDQARQEKEAREKAESEAYAAKRASVIEAHMSLNASSVRHRTLEQMKAYLDVLCYFKGLKKARDGFDSIAWIEEFLEVADFNAALFAYLPLELDESKRVARQLIAHLEMMLEN